MLSLSRWACVPMHGLLHGSGAGVTPFFPARFGLYEQMARAYKMQPYLSGPLLLDPNRLQVCIVGSPEDFRLKGTA